MSDASVASQTHAADFHIFPISDIQVNQLIPAIYNISFG